MNLSRLRQGPLQLPADLKQDLETQARSG